MLDLQNTTHEIGAVSSGIRCVPEPDLWFFLDNPDRNLYGPEGAAAMVNPKIRKITKGHHCQRYPHLEDCRISGSNRGFSLQMAIYWACLNAYEVVYLAGVDCSTEYAHSRPLDEEQKAHQFRVGMRMVIIIRDVIKQFPQVRFVSLSPGSPICELMETEA